MKTVPGILLTGLFFLELPLASPAAEVRTMHQQVAADPAGRVSVTNVKGSISVIGWDRPEVAATARLHGADLRLDVTSGDHDTQVEITGYRDSWFGLFGSRPFSEADLTVYVPRASNTTIKAASAAVRSSGVQGPQQIGSVSGAISADVAGAAVTVRTVSADITLRGDGHQAHVTASTVSGGFALQNGGGDLDVNSVSGRLQAALSSAREIHLHTISGDINLTAELAEGATLDANTISGDARIDAQSSAGFSYQARSLSGDLNDCFGDSPQRPRAHGPGYTLSGIRGAGGGQIHVRTLSGDIVLCDRIG